MTSFLRAGGRFLLVPVLGLGVGLAAAAITTAELTPTYQATASVIVLPTPTGNTDEVRLSDVSLAQNLVSSVAGLAESREVALGAAKALQLGEQDVLGHITGVSQLGTQIVTIQATASTASGAAAIANAATAAIITLSNRLHLGGSAVAVQPLDAAGVPGSPTAPRPLLNYALGALVGLLIGVGFVSLRSRLGIRFRHVSEIETDLGLPALGIIGRRIPVRRAQTAKALYSGAEMAAAIDGLVSTLSVFSSQGQGRRIVVTGIDDQTGATCTAALLAVGLQHHHRTATLVEAVPHLTLLDRYFDGPPIEDVGEVLGRTKAESEEKSGSPTVLTSPALDSYFGQDSYFGAGPRFEQIGALVDTMAGSGQDVIVLAPPVLAGGGCAELARRADVVILTVDIDRARRGDAVRAGLLVQRLGVPLAGVLVTGSSAEREGWQTSTWPTVPYRPAEPDPDIPLRLALPGPARQTEHRPGSVARFPHTGASR